MSKIAKRSDATLDERGGGVVSIWKNASARIDSWVSTITGLGLRGRDKVVSAFFGRPHSLDDQELEDLYNGDDLAARIVDAVVEDATRQGYSVEIDVDAATDDDAAEAKRVSIEVEQDLEDRLGALSKVGDAWAWGRLYGGAAVLVITDEGFDAAQETPLDLDRLRRVESLVVVDRRDLIVWRAYSDPTNPKFGQPELYQLLPRSSYGISTEVATSYALVHETRLVVFEGVRTTSRERQANQGWSFSVLQRVYDVLRQFNVTFQAVANLTQDSSQGVFSMDGLIDMIASGGKDDVATRMALVDLQRSVARSLVIDAEKEKFERTVAPMTGYPEVLQAFMLRLAAAARMPITVLMGQSPAGMNATGESDRLLWAQEVEAQRRRHLRPALTRLVELTFRSSEGPTSGDEPERWLVEFRPLVHMTEAEETQIRKTQAEIDHIYVTDGVLMPEEVAVNRFPMGGFSRKTTIDNEDREAILAGGDTEERPAGGEMSPEEAAALAASLVPPPPPVPPPAPAEAPPEDE